MYYKGQKIADYMLDPSISAKAKALFAIFSNDVSRKYQTIDDLLPILKEGRAAIRSGINELIKAGYVIRIDGRDPITKQFTKPDLVCNAQFTDTFYEQ